MSVVPFREPWRGARLPGTAVFNLLDGLGVPDWCNRCCRIFTLNNHGWIHPLTPNGEPDRMGRLMYESVCQECAMPRYSTTDGVIESA